MWHRDDDEPNCAACTGEACWLCYPGAGRPICEHDVIDRHGDRPCTDPPKD